VSEIKSTLDLVLEKTKDLSLNSEEKQKLAQQELEKRVLGLVGRYLDQLISVSRLNEELQALPDNEKDLAVRILTTHLVDHLDLGQDNSSVFTALKEIAGIDTASLMAIQEEYLSEKEEAKKGITDKMLAGLRERGIDGPAVIPNMENDPTWTNFLDGLNTRYRKRLEETIS
jgi:GH35 family endo-1,4-beta-xylanase